MTLNVNEFTVLYELIFHYIFLFKTYFQQQKLAEDSATTSYDAASYLSLEDFSEPKRKRYKKDTYFSDEEEIDDDT